MNTFPVLKFEQDKAFKAATPLSKRMIIRELLCNRQPATVPEIASKLGITQTQVATVLRRMEFDKMARQITTERPAKWALRCYKSPTKPTND